MRVSADLTWEVVMKVAQFTKGNPDNLPMGMNIPVPAKLYRKLGRGDLVYMQAHYLWNPRVCMQAQLENQTMQVDCLSLLCPRKHAHTHICTHTSHKQTHTQKHLQCPYPGLA